MLLMSLALAPAVAAAQEAGWPGLQGGPAHLGVTSTEVPPPFKVQWRLRLPGRGDRGLSAPAIAPDGAGVANGRTQVIGFDSTTGATTWTRPRARGSFATPAIASLGNETAMAIVVEGNGASNSGVLGLDLATGERRWRVPVREPVVAAPTVDGGVAYVGGRDRFAYAIDVETGKVRWKQPALGPVFASPAVSGGKVFVVSEDPATGQIRVVALATDTGKRLWRFELQTGVRLGSAAPVVGGDTVYVGLADSVLAIRAGNGKELWSSPIPSTFSPLSSLALSGNGVYAANGEGSLFRFDAGTGARRWDFQFDQAQSASSPVIDGGFVLLGLDDGDVVAVEAETGLLRWQGSAGAGPAGALAPAGSVILVSLQGRSGGLAALAHDPAGRLVRIESPTVLHVPVALVNFAVAFVAMLLMLVGLFRFVPGLRPPAGGEVP